MCKLKLCWFVFVYLSAVFKAQLSHCGLEQLDRDQGFPFSDASEVMHHLLKGGIVTCSSVMAARSSTWGTRGIIFRGEAEIKAIWHLKMLHILFPFISVGTSDMYYWQSAVQSDVCYLALNSELLLNVTKYFNKNWEWYSTYLLRWGRRTREGNYPLTWSSVYWLPLSKGYVLSKDQAKSCFFFFVKGLKRWKCNTNIALFLLWSCDPSDS